MFDQLMNFLKAHPERNPPDDMRVAVAVLLLEAAHRDDHFGPEERATIARLLKEKFALSSEECQQLIASCEATNVHLVQLYPYTHAILTHMDSAERIQVIEMLWEVVYADGVLDPEEDALIRRLGSLIDVTDRDRVLARQRVLSRMTARNTENGSE